MVVPADGGRARRVQAQAGARGGGRTEAIVGEVGHVPGRAAPPDGPVRGDLVRIDPAPRTIDCAECVMEATSACTDCVVTFVVGRSPGDALVIDAAVERDLRALGSAGLVPDLRHRARAG